MFCDLYPSLYLEPNPRVQLQYNLPTQIEGVLQPCDACTTKILKLTCLNQLFSRYCRTMLVLKTYFPIDSRRSFAIVAWSIRWYRNFCDVQQVTVTSCAHGSVSMLLLQRFK